MTAKHDKITKEYDRIYFMLKKVMAKSNFEKLQKLLELERELTLLETDPY